MTGLVIRDYTPDDFPRIAELHRMRGDDLWFPDPRHPINGVRIVAEDAGNVVGAALMRHTMEAFLILDTTLSPIRRARLIKAFVKEGETRARALGLAEYHAPSLDPRFHEFLVNSLGFNEDKRLNCWRDLTRTA